MITYLTHNQIDKQRWDDCIKQSPNGNVYALSWYLDIVHPRWEALVEDDYVSVMPLTGNRKCGISYPFQPFFVQQLGVFSKEDHDRQNTAFHRRNPREIQVCGDTVKLREYISARKRKH